MFRDPRTRTTLRDAITRLLTRCSETKTPATGEDRGLNESRR